MYRLLAPPLPSEGSEPELAVPAGLFSPAFNE